MSERTTILARAAGKGALAGVAGAALMLVTEKSEQALTGRPNSYVPGRALRTLAGQDAPDARQPVVAGHLMHFATGAVLGALRGMWASVGMRGPSATAAHATARLLTDQTVENLTGVGAPPTTWPVREVFVDVLHKGVYAVATGVACDRLIAPVLTSQRGTVSH